MSSQMFGSKAKLTSNHTHTHTNKNMKHFKRSTISREQFKTLSPQEKFKKGTLIWISVVLFYFFQFVLRVSPNACTDSLMAEYGYDAATLGGIMSFYYVGYVLMQLPAGVLLDRIGVRRPVVLAIIMCSLGVLLFAIASSSTVLTIARLMMGIGSAFAFLSNVKVASIWFNSNKMPLYVGLTLAAGTLGAKVAGSPLVYLLNTIGWKSALQLLAVCGGLLSLISWFIVKDVESAKVNSDSLSQTVKQIKTSLAAILQEPMSWVMGLYGLCMYIPLSGFCDLWGAAYIEDTFSTSRAVATDMSWLIYFGIGVSAPLWSFVHARFDSYRKSLFCGCLLAFITFSMVVYLPWVFPAVSLTLTGVLLFVCGLGMGAQFLAFSAVSALNCNSRTATSSAVHNMMCMLSGVISQPLIGFFMDKGASASFNENIIYSSQSYFYGLSVIVVALFIGLIACYLMRPLKSKLETDTEDA